MASGFHGPIDGGIVIPAPHCGPGGTMNFQFGGSTLTDEQKRKREPFSTVPFSRDPDFVARPDILAWIQKKCAAPASRAALVGLGGVGKSQLAIQYCHNVRAASPQTWVFWVHASTKARFEEAYGDIADRLELPGRNDPKVNTLKLVRDWLCDESNGQWLIVLDNADDAEVFYPKRKRGREEPEDMLPSLAAFLPQSHHGSILTTSRSKDVAVRLVGGYRNVKEVIAMDEREAVQLLRNKVENTPDEGSMADLIHALDRIPLAISQAAAYINRAAPRMTIRKYLEDFQENDKKKSNLLNRDAGDLRRDEAASNAIITTWQISFEQIRKERPSAADLLSLMSFFNPQGIPESVLHGYPIDSAGGGERDDDDSDIDEDLDTLRAYSLVTTTAESDVSKMHPLVQVCTRVWLSSFNELERWRRKFTRLMANEFPNGDFHNWTRCQALLPHVESMFEHEPAQEELLEDWAQILNNAAWYMFRKGRYEKAKSMAVSAIKAREKVKGQEHPSTLRSIEILGQVLRQQGKVEAAEEMFRRALEGNEKLLGKEHPDTLNSMSCLATTLAYQGKLEMAENMNWRVLEETNRTLGKEHMGMLTIMNDLAAVLQLQGKCKTAEKINRQALEGYEKTLGEEHPFTLISLSNLASILQKQGKFETAEEMYRRVIEKREKTLGKDHPQTLHSIFSLASFFHEQHQREAASSLYERAGSGYERVLGPEHPLTISCSRRYASLVQEMQ